MDLRKSLFPLVLKPCKDVAHLQIDRQLRRGVINLFLSVCASACSEVMTTSVATAGDDGRSEPFPLTL